MDNRSDIRDFLATRRARLTPEQVGLPTGGGRRRVAGLRREEVAVLAGVSIEWYTRLEKGHISGVSDDVLEAVARALRLDEEETAYLLDLARAASAKSPRRRRAVDVPTSVQWLLDSMTLSAAFVTNGRLDMVAANPLGRALYSAMLNGPTAAAGGTGNIARYNFLDPAARDFYADWDAAADTTVALLRAEAGRYPNDKALRELVGELSTVSAEFRTRWAAHDVRLHHGGVKRFRHHAVGSLELTYYPLVLPTSVHTAHTLTSYIAQPGSDSEDKLKLLTSWAATDTLRTGPVG
ncbi:helix-turn-helix transcriptional regulator [Spirilliplanes yamanashiensis]|uniref:Transcriptional regulator n=1 Tax=Spirilliplanes yamanashiensis TaxID=42233 RepID=A0A8J3YE21_9ACTN|nr:helix-turn-helix transcriptional regulator [Spirilliplanes yamanashiensis]MDP9818523.1 transcriptional regulator with XRE-family HTH domain [Spirilliplanes yamanashiensis]GIJ06349.1 transcriptional regulator [Spirilliplanes yamanashiensis]